MDDESSNHVPKSYFVILKLMQRMHSILIVIYPKKYNSVAYYNGRDTSAAAEMIKFTFEPGLMDSQIY
jgi:hypothetical protein